jgi:hypothetical protein
MAESDTSVNDGSEPTPPPRVAPARAASSVPERNDPEGKSAPRSATFWPHRRPLLPSPIRSGACVLFLLVLAAVCYRRPIPDDFDRYIYEAIVLGKSEPIQTVYNRVKHENRRAEASAILDSPQHLRELEPLYAIRPLYVLVLSALNVWLPIQHAINFVSSASLLGIGVVVLCWTKRPLETALIMAAYPVLALGRMGTPDALAALLAIAAVWLIHIHRQNLAGVILLFVSLGVRTDNALLLLAVLIWLAGERRIPSSIAALLGLLAIAVVVAIDRFAGNYGWVVLFRFSFVGGRYPAQIPHVLTVREYLTAFASGLPPVLTQLSLWLLIGVWAWMRRPNVLLQVVAGVVMAHFILFPSPEVRYLLWACIITAVLLIRSFAEPIPPERASI